MALRPRVDENGHLEPDAAAFLASWHRFGAPVSISMMGGLVDRRADLYSARQEWLDRNVRGTGTDPAAYEMLWDLLDADALRVASEGLKTDA